MEHRAIENAINHRWGDFTYAAFTALDMDPCVFSLEPGENTARVLIEHAPKQLIQDSLSKVVLV